jgi:hypothetical protein
MDVPATLTADRVVTLSIAQIDNELALIAGRLETVTAERQRLSALAACLVELRRLLETERPRF